MTWRDAVEIAVRRHAANARDGVFTRQEFLVAEENRILTDCGGGGETPRQTISRVLQELRRDGVLEFVDNHGTYRLNE